MSARDRDTLDFGLGYTGRTFVCAELGDEPIGLLITGPAAASCKYSGTSPEALCGGGIQFENSPDRYVRKPDGSLRPRWKVEALDPLTLSPSIQCGCGGQHGFIRGGRYENAGGIVS